MIDTLRRLVLCIFLCVLQVLLLNRICLFDMAMPLLLVYFVIVLPRGYPRWGTLLWSFFLGLSVDMFCNTPGVNAASLTAAGMAQPYLIEMFLPRNPEPNIKSSARTLGLWHFFFLSAILVVVFCLVFFTLDTFNVFAWLHILQCAGASALLTLMLVMAFEAVRK